MSRHQLPKKKGRSKAAPKKESALPKTMEGMMDLLANMHNLSPQELMKLQMELDDPSKVPPFPASKAKRHLSRMSEISSYEDIRDDDVHQLQCWCKEDFYMESIFDAGVVPILVKILKLSIEFASKRVANNITKRITKEQERNRELTLYSIADGLLNENNKVKTDLGEVVPLLKSMIRQEGDIRKGFPMGITAMNYAIKALGESFRALGVQNNEPEAIEIMEDTPLLEIIRAYIRNDRITTPIGMQVSSLLCSLRFVQMLAMTSHRSLHILVNLGYREALQAIPSSDAQTNMLVQQTLGLFQGKFDFPKEVPVDSIAYHTKKQVKRLCAYCNIEEDPASPHKKCSRCKQRHYCSRDCQVSHWKSSHSKECASLTTK